MVIRKKLLGGSGAYFYLLSKDNQEKAGTILFY